MAMIVYINMFQNNYLISLYFLKYNIKYINMKIVYSFIGKLPDYIIYSIHQTRLYCNDDIYLIYNDYTSEHINIIKNYEKIHLIKYDDINKNNLDTLKKYYNKFAKINALGDRKELFYYSFERTYLLYNLTKLLNLENILFLELDNLIYSDPNNWIKHIDKDVAFMIDNVKRASIGTAYFKNSNIIKKIIDYFDNDFFSNIKNVFLNEMLAYYRFYEKNKNDCFILPSFIDSRYIASISENFNKFNSLFDPLSYGIFLLGYDKIHQIEEKNKGIHKINEWGIIKDLNKNNVIWKNIEGYIKPFFVHNNNYYLINNLHIHSKNLNMGLSIKNNIISGEKFQYIADIYIGDKEFDSECHIYNDTLQKNKCLNIKNIQNNETLLNSKIIYIYTHVYYNHKDLILNILSMKENPFILLFHNSDYIINESFSEIFIKTKCYKIFSQNVCYKHKDIQYLPIGIANCKWPHGNLQLLNYIIHTNTIKENNVFFNFNIGTNLNKRNICYNTIKNKGLIFSRFNNQLKYWEELKKCKFCISPEGNGPDCHRIWECLYLDVIPICERSFFIENISNDFPIYIIDNWDSFELNDELFNKYDNMISSLDKNKLKFSYWNNIINSNLSSIL